MEGYSKQHTNYASRLTDKDEESMQGLLSEKNVPKARWFSTEPSNLRKAWTFAILQLILIACYTATFNIFGRRIFSRSSSLVYSPAQSAVERVKYRFNSTLKIDSPFNGPPGPTTDGAWHDLLDNMNIAVPKSDLSTHSIPIPSKPGYEFAGLGVFHELHCLKRLRQHTWLDHYFPNLTADESRLNRLHSDHCLEILRQSLLCHADTSLFTLQWSEGQPQPRADFSQEHECVDFGAINAWAKERRVDVFQPGVLVHPVYGPAYREGESSRIGGSEDESKTIITDEK